MATNATSPTALETLLAQQSDQDWARIVGELNPAIHLVDRKATLIWFSFFPVKLYRALSTAEDPAEVAKKLILKGNYLLRDQIDRSAEFLYGHRYWPEVRKEVAAIAATGSLCFVWIASPRSLRSWGDAPMHSCTSELPLPTLTLPSPYQSPLCLSRGSLLSADPTSVSLRS